MRGVRTPDYYQLFGVQPTASHAEIKARYRYLSKKHHPDVGGSQAYMAQLNHAYAVLSDTFKRAIYDAERRTLGLTASSTAHDASVRRSPVRAAVRHSKKSPKTRRSMWWPKLVWGFAALVVAVGGLMHLPVTEAILSTDAASTTKTLDITYPADYVASSPAPAPAAGSGSDAGTLPAPQGQPQPADETHKTSQKTEDRDCTTKSYGSYQRTVCRSADGTKVCSINTLGNQRFGDCD